MSKILETQKKLASFLAEAKKLPNGGVDPKSGYIVIPEENKELGKMQGELLRSYMDEPEAFTGIKDDTLIRTLAYANDFGCDPSSHRGGLSGYMEGILMRGRNKKLALVFAERCTEEDIGPDIIRHATSNARENKFSPIDRKIATILIKKAPTYALEEERFYGVRSSGAGSYMSWNEKNEPVMSELKQRAKMFEESLNFPLFNPPPAETLSEQSTNSQPTRSKSGASRDVILTLVGAGLGTGIGAGIAHDYCLNQHKNSSQLEPATTHSQQATPREPVDTSFVTRAKPPAASHVEQSAKGNGTGTPAR